MRFDVPGGYAVTVKTLRALRRPRGQLTLWTKPVVFDIEPTTEEEEAKEIKRLSELIDSRDENSQLAATHLDAT